MTKIELEALRLADAGRRLRDGDGVIGVAYASKDGSVSVRFSLRYKVEGRVREVRLGTWPKVSLAEMRAERDKVRAEVRSRIDPIQRRLAKRLEDRAKVIESERQIAEEAARLEAQRVERLTVRDLFDTWIADGVVRKDGGAELRRSFEKDVIPVIGGTPVRAVTEADIRALLRGVVQRGRNRLAVLMLADLRQMFRWGEKRPPWRRLMIEGNPAELVKAGTVTSDDYGGNERTRVLSSAELKELRDKLARARADYEKAQDKRKAPRPLPASSEAALWIMLSTTCRIGEIARAQWEDVDLDARTWLVPPKNSKNAKAQMVYLADFALQQFRVLKHEADNSEWVLPAKNREGHVCPKSFGKQIADRQAALAGRKPMKHRSPQTAELVLAGGRWTAHDLRRTGATMMQSLGVTPLIVDRCLNHVEGNVLRRVYQVHEYADEKREAWQMLGERIETILGSAA
ncbi:MAG: tyrosine-type recombinase/integrase [Burkholderiaceae bacterium]|nr:tyrosine-type recombinase/integrase [Burkholderiaceae bacterium]